MGNSTPKLEELRDCLQGQKFRFNMYWEGTGDRSWLADNFRRDKDSVLIGTDFWEGIDIPGAKNQSIYESERKNTARIAP